MNNIKTVLFHRCALIVAFFCLCFAWTACSDDAEDSGGSRSSAQVDTAYTVAVVMPLQEYGRENIQRFADWFQENLSIAQAGFDRKISLNLEWYDEGLLNLDSLAQKLRMRKDVMAVIGPLYSSSADIMANRLRGTLKTQIVPCATSAELIHTYAGKGFYWSLVESDITQCEVLLTRAKSMGAKSVSLLASNGLYGKTFIDWFSFQALELGLHVTGVYNYPDDSSIQPQLQKALAEEHNVLLCVPDGMDGIKAILQARRQIDPEVAPTLLFADMAYFPGTLELGELSEFIEGVTPSADPESGFDVAFKVRFNDLPNSNGAQFYDAFMLAALAINQLDCAHATSMNEALKDVVAHQNADGSIRPHLYAWDADGLRKALYGQRYSNTYYDIHGASGGLDFDEELLSSVVRSVYAHWMVYNGKFITLNHLSSDGSHRSEAYLASWNWLPTVTQDFDANQEFSYPEHKDNWALLIAASNTWTNYRHQADVLNMYQILRRKGYPDDHIVLIQEDDLVNNPQNDYPGTVLRYDGVNLYTDIHTDYHLSDITADDIERIMTGESSDRLPHVLKTTENDNILVFWSGHGVQGAFQMADRPVSECFTKERMAHLLTSMQQRKCYRKMLWLVETCYSASVAAAAEAEEVPGVLFITAAGALEPSKADVKIDGVYRTNRFSEVLMTVLSEHPDASYRELYYYSTHYTTGSHITVLNASRFDNLYKSTPQEFLRSVKIKE